jgi:hypothetical protein
MLVEEKRRVERDVCELLLECRQYFEPTFDIAFAALGETPYGVDAEIRNANNHLTRALSAAELSEAELHSTAARRHYYYATYLCLIQIVSHRLAYCEDYQTTLALDFRLRFPDLKWKFRELRRRQNSQRFLHAPLRRDTSAELDHDTQLIAEETRALERFATEIEDFLEVLHLRCPLDVDVVNLSSRSIQRSILQLSSFWMLTGFALAAILGAAASAFALWLYFHR